MENSAVPFEKAKTCEDITSIYKYLKDKDEGGKGSGMIVNSPCDVCVLQINLWNEEFTKGPSPKVTRFGQSCGTQKSIDDFEDEYGGVGKCKFHPHPTKKGARVKCACKGDKCNQMKGDLVIPNDKWAAKMVDADNIPCDDGKYAFLIYTPFAANPIEESKNKATGKKTCHKEEDIKGDMAVGSCVASYKVYRDKIGPNPALVVTCISDGPRSIDRWSAKFPNRVWEYQKAAPPKPVKTTPKPNPNPNPTKKPNGATDIFVSFASNVLVFATTVLIAY